MHENVNTKGVVVLEKVAAKPPVWHLCSSVTETEG